MLEDGPQMEEPLPFAFHGQHTDNRQHTVVNFLQRPQVIFDSSWASDAPRNKQFMDSIMIPDDIISFPMFAEKLKGFSSLRATAVITVQFQTQPFQAGRVMLGSFPLPTLNPTRVKFATNHVSRLMLLNHVQCDIAKETEVSLRIPFVSPYNSYDLVSKRFPWAKVVGLVYSPLTTTIPVDFIVYGHFEDVELGCPTSGMLAQSGLKVQPPTNSDSRQRAKESKGKKDYSKTGAAFKQSVSKLGEHLPFLKSGANWVSENILQPADEIIGPILSLFGFSKPLLPIANPTVLRPANTFAITDTNDMSHSLALSNDTNVPFVKALDGSGLDEMSFDYLKKIPQFIQSKFFTTTTKPQEVLFQTKVMPHYFVPGGDVNVAMDKDIIRTIWQPSHLAYITSMFKYWTGSLVYTFKFVKTDYHSGRVEISFHPFSDYTAGTYSDYTYRIIVDLREKSEFSVTIPFISPVPYKRISRPDWDKPYSKYAHASTGTLVLKALTSLKATNTVVSNSVEILIEVNAGDDFNVIAPIENIFFPFSLSPGRKGMVAQSNSGTEQQNPRGSSLLTDPESITKSDPYNPNISLLISGEVFTNFRNLIKRVNFRKATTLNGKRISDTFDINSLIEAPRLDIAQYVDTETKEAKYGFSFFWSAPTTLNIVAEMYALYRGGVRVKVVTEKGVDFVRATVSPQQTYGSDVAPTTHISTPLAIEQIPIKGVAEFQIPYYAPCLSSSFRANSETFYYSSGRNNLDIATSPPSINRYYAVGAGDDMDFSIFIGTPPCIHASQTAQFTKIKQGKVYDLRYDQYDPFREVQDGTAFLNARSIEDSDLL